MVGRRWGDGAVACRTVRGARRPARAERGSRRPDHGCGVGRARGNGGRDDATGTAAGVAPTGMALLIDQMVALPDLAAAHGSAVRLLAVSRTGGHRE